MNRIAEISQAEKTIDDFHLGPINIEIKPGTITALVGNNGSGKSTLLKLLMNLAKPDKGNIRISEKLVFGPDESWKTQVSYQPQTVIGWNAFTGNTLKEFISPLYPDWDDSLFTKMAKLFDIPLNKRFGKLSQGVQQKLNLALTVPRNTPLVLLDEPTSFMDIPSKKHFIDLLADWMDDGNRAIVMTSHQSADIMKLADYLYVLQGGKMIGTYEKDELIGSYLQYWMKGEMPALPIPGELSREHQRLITCSPEAAEAFFQENDLTFTSAVPLDLEEIISLLLTERKER
ncbi:ABC transporter ATP-binding protein [Virgibacillus indicus]|uniref:ABC transporter ATP-binding protein n=1 Tax=Virgibacillus indicus TaxID=2024554 RepID=A0A265NBN3_9BACI|nr:ABC transporter ATP-binding protein [Virgibacillus indicus]OZU89237.1 ABC transporter ATP-binding protein [Virgibacillus indicus]